MIAPVVRWSFCSFFILLTVPLWAAEKRPSQPNLAKPAPTVKVPSTSTGRKKTPPSAPLDWKAGLATTKITPDTLMWMAGYAARSVRQSLGPGRRRRSSRGDRNSGSHRRADYRTRERGKAGRGAIQAAPGGPAAERLAQRHGIDLFASLCDIHVRLSARCRLSRTAAIAGHALSISSVSARAVCHG